MKSVAEDSQELCYHKKSAFTLFLKEFKSCHIMPFTFDTIIQLECQSLISIVATTMCAIGASPD